MASITSILQDGVKKNKKAAFSVAWMRFLVNFQAQKATQERKNICRKVFIISPKNDNLHSRDGTCYGVISVVHENVYGIIQREARRK